MASRDDKLAKDGNGFEWAVRETLTRRGMRFEVDKKPIPGTPDIVFSTDKIAVFLDGCFWHGCALHRGSPQKLDYWLGIWKESQRRDTEVNSKLAELGWVVLRYWEHNPIEDISADIEEARRLLNRTRNHSA